MDWHSKTRGVYGSHAGGLRRAVEAGFTLLELMIVVAIILILAGMAAVRYDKSIALAKDAAMRHDLSVMRDAIEQYTLDKEQAPQSLDDLVSAGYLRQIPVDPVTRAKDWVTDTCDTLLSPDQESGGGICDVHSPSEKASSVENTP
ncbi:MAG TPA: type II secretion system protein [Candidatus Acidoferrales bacterium]|nr:type II secretion system protein [Candidatus Acidoferrales bacterium]